MVIHIKFPRRIEAEKDRDYWKKVASDRLEECLTNYKEVKVQREENGGLRNRLSLAYAERGDREITLNKVIEERDQLKADNRMLTQHNSELRMMLAIASQRLRAMFLNQTSTKQ